MVTATIHTGWDGCPARLRTVRLRTVRPATVRPATVRLCTVRPSIVWLGVVVVARRGVDAARSRSAVAAGLAPAVGPTELATAAGHGGR